MCRMCGWKASGAFSGAVFAAADVSGGGASIPPALQENARSALIPSGLEDPRRRKLIKGGIVLSMDPAVGDFASADILIEGKRIVAIGPSLDAPDAAIIDAAGMIVMPGFIDTHHHQFETALRGYLADGLLYSDGRPHGSPNYIEDILGKLSTVYRPEDVYINELVASLSQLDAGVTSVLDVSQIHHTPEHSEAAIQGLKDAHRRTAFGYFEGRGPGTQYPHDAARLKQAHFSSTDQLLTMVMGGEFYHPAFEHSWRIGRELDIPIALHVVASRKERSEAFDQIVRTTKFGPDNIFIHMTGVSDLGWQAAKDAGAHVTLAVPIEMTMRHGMPPILKMMEMGMSPSLSSDVECTMTADFFTQMRSMLTLQRALANEAALSGMDNPPALLTSRDVIRFATVEGARALRLDDKVGTLAPGKEADIILLRTQELSVAPLNNVPGTVVTLMDRSHVDSVLVAGAVRKWQGSLVGVDSRRLVAEISASRDYLFEAAGVDRPLF